MTMPTSLNSTGRQHGGAAPFILLLIGAGLMLAAYATDSARMKSSAAQLKRATDAAAMAAAMAYAADSGSDIQSIAEKYVNANLGMDSAQTGNNLAVGTSAIESSGDPGVRVTATFLATSLLNGAGPADVTVASAAVARNKSLEVALILPNTSKEDSDNLNALRTIGNEFAENLIGTSSNTWLALVPHSQAVSVYDADYTGRVRSWASSTGLNPVELTSLFSSGYGSLADRRIPDRRYNLLCMYRGLNQGENYFWDEAPANQFRIYYRADLPANAVESYYISWVGPNPSYGQATGANDTRYMVVDKGCPYAALLPLSNDLDQISERLDAMRTGYNVNYAIAMGWAAMALAPAFQGSSGWGLDDDLPKEFDDGSNSRIKAIVMLVNSSDMSWFDSDAYNAYVGETIDGCPTDGSYCSNSEAVITQRFANLCSSFRKRNLKFYLIVTGNDEAEDESTGGTIASASAFRRVAGAGLSSCAEDSSDLTYYSGADFVASQSKISSRLKKIVKELRQEASYVRLIE